MSRPEPTFLLHERFAVQARQTPGNVALYYRNGSITYAELEARSDRLAGHLRAQGIRGGSAVGLYMERSIDYVVSLLAILKANAAVVPLPPSYPEGRLSAILSFAALDAVIDHDETPLRLTTQGRVIRFGALPSTAGDARAAASGHPNQSAFVLCSSGSTGTPKMIVRSHRSFAHRLEWTWATHPYATDEVCCQKAHMTTTHAIYELFEPLLRGIPVVIIPDEVVRSIELFWDTIRAKAISRLLIVPSMLQASLDMPGFVAPPLKVVVLMGEYVHAKLAERTLEAFPEPSKIYSIYGSTEASSTLVCDLRESFRAGSELPLGRPISPDVRAYVLDANLEQVAPGEAGTLYIAGSALFKEYFRSPELTAPVFVTAPGAMGTLYHTHDQVRRTPDGELHFVGRIGHTVKVRGFRVDLHEVERALLLHPGVAHAAVALSEGGAGNSALLGFYAPNTVDEAALYRVLRAHLPAYMVPSVLIGLDSFPLTASGKIDRRRLVEEHAGRAASDAPGELRSKTEARVVEVWGGLLGHRAIGTDSSFFEVGGTSLTVFAAVHRLRAAFNLSRDQLSDQTMYRCPTVGELAAYIDSVAAGHAPLAPSRVPLLVTLKRGNGVALPPFFLIASAGGTLGAYEKLVKALRTRRDVIGVRDPFVWGDRDPTLGFQHWVGRYVDAIRERQSHGPYYIGAYSSAGAFGYEIARQLRHAGSDVALLTLIDPLALDKETPRRFGYWALRARFMRPSFERIVRLGGWLRTAAIRAGRATRVWSPSTIKNDQALTRQEFLEIATEARTSRGHFVNVSALLELNTGLPFALTDAELSQVEPNRYVEVLLERVRSLAPEIDPANIENILVQYYLQTRAHHVYKLQRYEGTVALFEPDSPHRGLLAALLRPHVDELRVRYLKLGNSSPEARSVAEAFSPRLRTHYLSMRDDAFVNELAGELDVLLEGVVP